MRKSVLFLGAIALVSIATSLVGSRSALAFHQVKSFAQSANTGGAGGSYFTGSKRAKGYDCRICHVGSEGRISVKVISPLTSGSYRAGLIYPITVKLIGEHRGLDSAFNPNTFTASIVDGNGLPLGKFAVGGDPVMETAMERSVAIAQGMGNGESEWSFDWWAPVEVSQATLHIAMLDGDGARETERRFIDPLSDDVALYRLDLCPEGLACEPTASPSPEGAPMGCSTTGLGPSSAAQGLVLGILMLLLRRRSRWRVVALWRGSAKEFEQ